jgi:hypothetical protein
MKIDWITITNIIIIIDDNINIKIKQPKTSRLSPN